MNAFSSQVLRVRRIVCVAFFCLVGCTEEKPLTGTGPFVTTGLLNITGRVWTEAGAPLTGFRVYANVNDDDIIRLYPAILPVLSGANGSYSTQLERIIEWRPPTAPDSVPIRLAAESVRPEDHNADGSVRRVETQAWGKFGRPPQAPGALIVDFVIPNKR